MAVLPKASRRDSPTPIASMLRPLRDRPVRDAQLHVAAQPSRKPNQRLERKAIQPVALDLGNTRLVGAELHRYFDGAPAFDSRADLGAELPLELRNGIGMVGTVPHAARCAAQGGQLASNEFRRHHVEDRRTGHPERLTSDPSASRTCRPARPARPHAPSSPRAVAPWSAHSGHRAMRRARRA
jgi:hypothetical protein